MNEQKITYFSYFRKSTDETDRQVLSLSSQEAESSKKFSDLKTIKLPPESVSAFEPYKRPIFAEMIARIQKGEAQGIIAWHPDRLARNPMDAAQIIYLLDTGKLKDLKFCSYYFDNSPEGKMMLQITLSQSKYSSDKLSKDVKRGMDKKATSGARPNLVPIGYRNSKTNLKGEQDISIDLQRFHLVKQLWDKMLTGNCSTRAIKEYSNQFGLTQPATRKLPERPLREGMLYNMFKNPFYYGWYEWPTGSGNWIKASHEPMVTEEEFDTVQRILGRKGKQRPKKNLFAFTGLMRCSCGGMITADEKYKRQKNGNVHHYVYYHCGRKINKNCTEKAVRLDNLTKQIDEMLAKIEIPERFQKWAIKYLHELRTEQAQAKEDAFSAKQKALLRVTQQLDGLMLKFTSPENFDGSLFTTQEYQSLKGPLLKEKVKLEDELKDQGQQMEEWLELSERTFNFARYARTWFAKDDIATKRAIFACIGSDLLLKDQKLTLELKKPFKRIFEGLSQSNDDLTRVRPLDFSMVTSKLELSDAEFSSWSG